MRRLAVLALLISLSVGLIAVACGEAPKALAPQSKAAAAGSSAARRPELTGGRTEVPVSHTTIMSIYRNLRYADAGGQQLLLDAYVPASGTHPAVVVIHGGGWSSGDKRILAFEGENLAAAGFAAFVVDYRPAPPAGRWHAPDALDDVRAAVGWVRANSGRYRVVRSRVGALGNSAGGNLAMMLGTTGTSGGNRVAAVVSYSGQSELLALSSRHTVQAATNYIGCAKQVCPGQWLSDSPIAHVDAATAPMLLVNSRHELMPVQQATDMAQRLQQAGVAHTLLLLDGRKHASAYANQVWPQTLSFLRQYLAQ